MSLAVLWVVAGAGAAPLPLWLGPARPPVAINWPADACAEPTDPLERAVWAVVRAQGGSDVSCGNAFIGYLRTPQSLDTPQDAFAGLAEQIEAARSEVLLTNMQWDSGPGTPGWTVAQAVARLYAWVRANPAAYPHGMTVRLLLGNYPQLSRPDGTDQILALMQDLRTAGVPLSDPQIGWALTLLRFASFPHSHVKLQVIDGQDLTVAGFNLTNWHLPVGAPGGWGLHDLGLHLRGPVAQAGVAAFDDLQRHSLALVCPDNVTPAEVRRRCTLGPAPAPSHPAPATEPTRTGDARAFVLYRRPGGENLADEAHLALLGAAQTSLDLMQSDFGTDLACWYAYLHPEGCVTEALPVYFWAVLNALDRGVQVRLLVVDYGVGAAANRSGVALLRREMARRSVPADRLQARYSTFPMHTKAMTVDGSMTLVGSMNFHFSAWGTLGLAEAALATSDPAAVAGQQASFEQAWLTGSRPIPPERWQAPGTTF
ncbi:phospholipase D-like domain-containing protein [Deinococcus sp. HMF7604]|uniref:phospholipase D-like domain-containing protein n=1 Tax=Deinococcus betulae TaxID=2873312 RepID=UPI001CC9E383|nr:phospholipase D-like domain-containing protein [Deinococcus betulae]